MLLLLGFISITHAQLGSGWVSYSPTKKIHLDNEAGLQTYTWTSYKSVCSPICADYRSENDVETFRLLDNRTNRSEIRLQNEYSTGSRQFEGYLTIYAPLNDESVMQIFGSTSGATQMMIRGYASNGGSLTGAGQTLATNIYGVEVRVNVIHLQEDRGNKIIIYINGVKKAEIVDNENVTNYHKYGNYGTLTTDEAVVKWRRARFFRDGSAPTTTNPVTNLALNRPVTFSSQPQPENPGSAAVDGNTSTRWAASGYPQWIEVDLGSTKSISKTELVCFESRAYRFTVDVKTTSTGSYTRIVDRSTNTTPGSATSPITNSFSPVNARYVRLTVTGASGYTGTWVSINEFRVFGTTATTSTEQVTSSEIFEKNEVPLNKITAYPNPFGEKNTVGFTIEKEGRTNVSVYDQLGRQVAVLQDGFLNKGTYTRELSGKNLPKGFYIIQLTNNGKTITQKISKE